MDIMIDSKFNWKRPHHFIARYAFLKSVSVVLLVSFFIPVTVQAQTGAIEGTVTDTTGQPIPGVNIVLGDTQIGAVTNAQGQYDIADVPGGTYTVRASFIGYADRVRKGVEVTAGQTADLHFTLREQATALEDVVVVAYGESEQANMTGSISEVSGESVDDLPVTGAKQALAGLAAGVEVSRSSGYPGGGTSIKIRGLGSINASQAPLYVIDGFPIGNGGTGLNSPIDFLAPQDIESISVLKGASAASLYGSRASNGVVLITTKQGSSGKPTISFSASVGLQSVPSYEKPDVLNAEEYVRFNRQIRIDDYIVNNDLDVAPENFQDQYPEVFNEIVPEAMRNPESYGAGTNWFNAITETAPMHEYDLSVRGGTEDIQYYVSGGFTDQQGVVVSSGFQRFSFRSNLNATITDKLRFGLSLSPSRTIQDRASTDPNAGFDFSNLLNRVRHTPPTVPLRNEDGSLHRSTRASEFTSFYATNPLYILQNEQDERIENHVLLNSYLEFEPFADLVFKTTFGTRYHGVYREQFTPSTIARDVFQGDTPTIPSGRLVDRSLLNILSENTVSYNNTIADQHDLDILAGVTAQRQYVNRRVMTGTDYPNDEVSTLNAAPTIEGTQNVNEWTLLSYLGRLEYNFDDRYLVTAAFRADGSSRFGANNRWGYFPSVSFGWRLENEPFMEGLQPTLSQLKLRASYGETGNNSIGNYAALGSIGTDDYVLGGTLASGRTPTSLGNSSLSWEEKQQVSLGFDVGFFNDRLMLSGDFYRGTTSDLLFSVPVAAVSGFSSTLTNIGEVRNQGMEFTLETRNLDQALTWSSNFNISFNRNEVLSLGREDTPIRAGGAGRPLSITKVGGAIGQFYGLQLQGLWTQEEIDAFEEEHGRLPYSGVVPGAVKFRDANNNDIYEGQPDFTTIGSPWPDFTFGITNTLGYRGFDLKLTIDGSIGQQIFDQTRSMTQNTSGIFNVSDEVLERFRPGDNPENYSVPTTVGQQNRIFWRYYNSAFVEDASYVSLRNVTLGYDLSEGPLSQYLGSPRNARLYLSIQNALLFSEYDGNPEVGKPLTTNLAQNVNYGSYPVTRTFTLGINLSL